MSRTAKIAYFFVSLLSMTCLALASLSMATGRPYTATALFVIAFLMIGAGFIARKRLLKASKVQEN